MPLCRVPDRPTATPFLRAHSILERACDAAEAFVSAFATVRRARKAKGTPTDHEQDLMRAGLVFAAAGLDTLVKQLIREPRTPVVSKNKG